MTPTKNINYNHVSVYRYSTSTHRLTRWADTRYDCWNFRYRTAVTPVSQQVMKAALYCMITLHTCSDQSSAKLLCVCFVRLNRQLGQYY